jgi:hypothetical protein
MEAILMKWFITQDIGNISQRLTDIGEIVVSTPDMHRDPSDPDMEEAKDYKLAALIKSVEDFDVLFLGNIMQSPFYTKGASKLWYRAGGRVLMGGTDRGATAAHASQSRLPRCIMGVKQLEVFATNDMSSKNRLPPRVRVFDLNGDIRELVRAANDSLVPQNFGETYG